MPGPDGLSQSQSPPGGEDGKEAVASMGKLCHDLLCLPYCRAVPSVGAGGGQSPALHSQSGDDGGGQDGLFDGCVKLDHRGRRKSEFPQLPEKTQSLRGLPSEGCAPKLPLNVPGENHTVEPA